MKYYTLGHAWSILSSIIKLILLNTKWYKMFMMLVIFPSIFTAVHTIAHWYNYERFVAFNPPTSVTEFGLPDGSFVPDESTVVVAENTVS